MGVDSYLYSFRTDHLGSLGSQAPTLSKELLHPKLPSLLRTKDGVIQNE